MEERPETAKNLTLEDLYRKEFVQALDVQTQALTDNVEATCDILAPVINLLPSLDNDHKEEDVDSLVKMLPRSLQPNNDVLCAELTLFRNHCRENKLEIETIAEAARLALKVSFNKQMLSPDFNCTYYKHRRRVSEASLSSN